MKTEAMTSNQTTSPMSNSLLSSNAKYGGMVQKKAYKLLRNYIFILIGYIDTSGPCLFAASERFWPLGSLHQKFVSYITVIFHLVPIEYRYEAGVYIDIIYIVLVVFYFTLLISSALVYKTTSKLPKAVVILIRVFDCSFMFLIHPIALQMASQDVSRLIEGMDTAFPKVATIVIVALTYVCAFFYFYMFAHIMSITLIFRPTSMQTTSNVPQLFLFISTYLTTIISGVASYLPRIPYVVLTILNAGVMFFTAYIPFLPGSFVKSRNMKLIFTSGATGGCFSLIICVFGILDKKASMAILFISIAIFVIIMIVSFPIIDSYEKSCLRTLDLVAEDQSVPDHFKKENHLIRDACIGYKYAHPVCLDWSLFKAGSEIWPESSNIWATFGKFVAIYPEESNLLSYIIRSIETKKLKGNFAKQTIAQGRMILVQRETSLTPALKRKMQHVGKSVQHSKRKLRHIWDIVIQGNTHEMENAVNQAYNTINKTQAEFNHVLSQYPNNRFISRSYARFLQEIKADFKGFQEWVEKVKVLQRGLTATPDNTNILGVEAFPNLPRVLAIKNDNVALQATGETESAFQLEVDIEDNEVSEQMAGIRDQINSLTIPALKCISIATIVSFIVMIVCPIIIIYFIARNYIDSLNKPLEFTYYLSYLRSLANQLPSFSFHSIFEEYPPVDEGGPLFKTPDLSDIEVPSLGNYNRTKDQYAFLIKELTISLEAIGKFRSYKADNPTIKLTNDRTFKSITPYYFFHNNGSYSIINVSIQSALMDYTIQLSKLNSIDNIDPEIFKSSIVMNPLMNTETLNNYISYSIQQLRAYVRSVRKDMNKLMTIVFVSLIAFFLVYYTLFTFFEMRNLQLDKHEIYSCLTSLPKNVVSGLAESLRILKKDTEGTRTTEVDTEFSKQEDNILKIFATAGDDTGSSSDKNVFIACNVFLLVIEIILTFFLTNLFKKVTTQLDRNGPHLSYVFGATAFMMEAENTLNVAAATGSGKFNYTINETDLLLKLNSSYNYFNFYYQQARYGGLTKDDRPFAYFDQINEEAEIKYACPDPDAVKETYREIYSCFSADQQSTLFFGILQKLSLPVIEGNASHINTSDPLFDELWYVSAILLYESFYHPMFVSILPQLKATIEGEIPDTFPGAIALAIVGLVFVVITLIYVSLDSKKLKFALSLLLHVQSQVIMQTQKIVDVLNGHFVSKGKDSKTRNHKFFTEIVSILPDSVITINNQMEITAANKSTERVYSMEADELVGTKISDFLSSSYFSENMTKVVENATPANAPCNPVLVQYTKGQNSTNYLELSCVSFNQFLVLTTRDVTRMFVYNTLIEEERSKSDKLLASILPPSLVVRVQKGEKNISFAVQTATILFLDIVSFTPWCASNTAAMVMSTLNTMFKLLDNKLATHDTATKIKCIGDCYMCAGGIFDEVNQPHVHAKEITEFGQESIECVRQLDEELELQLQIRVGINTGGPIVAGVLGTEKPTFEILGPAINMAQQMEHHGVPMQVHISRSVYELIYGGSFVIKERGQIEIKSGKVITYLVQDKNAA
ncbi:hypothetical protein M9Y10_031193 [Tritrichomonas musculus]|uniref:Adenylate and Guanylate cyclase catalytic domain containing protein n=1 Tax=Tritrichomonas musculus TaxID=1915356 RepID=A0ABR2H219_9EUKA